MARLPSLKPREVVRAFERLGYKTIRQKGSHLWTPGRSPVVVPMHRKDVKLGTLSSLLRGAGIERDEFLVALKKETEVMGTGT